MICESCGCSEARPCFEEELGQPCTWGAPGLCSAGAVEDLKSGTPFALPRADRLGPHYRQRLSPRQVA